MHGHAVHVCDLARADAGGERAVAVSRKRREIDIHDGRTRGRALRYRQSSE